MTGQRVVLVTGSTGAIGFEIAAQAATPNTIVIVHGRSAATCENTVAKLKARAADGQFDFIAADFMEDGAIVSMIDAIIARHGRLDAVINSAVTSADGVSGPFLKTNPQQYANYAHRTNATLEMLCHAALPHLIKSRGAIVAIASDAGRFAAARQALTGATRAGIMGFVRNLAVEIARDGVRINCLSPSFVEATPIFDKHLGVDPARADRVRSRAGLGLPRPEDIAPIALYMCGPHTTKITGQIISINGGMNA